MKQLFKHPKTLTFSLIGGFGGFLLGYNTAIISGVLLVLKENFVLNTARQANLVSIILLGALIGAVAAGFVADKIGRKKTLLMTMGFYFLGALSLTCAHDYWLFSLGRFIAGIGAGIGAFAIPLYLSEIAPPKFRGGLVSINQLSVTLGILAAFIMNYAFDMQANWRVVFGLCLVISAAEAGLIYRLPESPSWLIAMSKRKEARAVLRLVRPNEDSDRTIAQIEKHLMNASKDYFMKKVIVPSIIAGVVLSVMQQITGINVVIYYAPTIFQKAGFSLISSATLATVGIGIVNVLATIASLFLVDRIGRKPLLIFGLGGMATTLFLLSLSNFFNIDHMNRATFVCLILYVASFAVSLGPVIWLLISEIFPLAIRGKVVALCVFCNFLMNYIVSLVFLPLFNLIGGGYVFLIFALFSCASIYYVFNFVPETKEKNLEDIEKFWKK
jgi:sugar porter (SP) family MFS transporter